MKLVFGMLLAVHTGVKPRRTNCKYRCMSGFSYVEMLIATMLIAIALVPAMDALLPAMQGSAIHKSATEQHYHLTAMLEYMLAKPFIELDNEAMAIGDPTVASNVYSDPAMSAERRLVYLSRYDADNADANANGFDGTDAGLLWIRVEIEGSNLALETLTSQYE